MDLLLRKLNLWKSTRMQHQLTEDVWGETVMQHVATGVEAGTTMNCVREGMDVAWRQSGLKKEQLHHLPVNACLCCSSQAPPWC